MMLKFLIIIALIGVISSQDCDDGWTERPSSNSCYYFSSDAVTDKDASKKCLSFSAKLVSIDDATEQTFLQTSLAQNSAEKFWIGLKRESSLKSWAWLNGDALVFLNWHYSYDFQTSDKCAYLDMGLNGKWKTNVCSGYWSFFADKYNFICEKPRQQVQTTTPATLPTQPGMTYGCKQGWNKYGSNCYKYYDTSSVLKTFDEARLGCQIEDSQLLEVFSENEDQFVKSLLKPARSLLSNKNFFGCPASWKQSNDQCYKLIATKERDWNKAKETCKLNGGNLATIKSPEENEYLANFVSQDIWIGLQRSKDANIFYWLDGSSPNSIPFLNWEENFPSKSKNQRCGVLRAGGIGINNTPTKKWYDVDCIDYQNPRYFVCQTDVAIQDNCTRYTSDTFAGGASCVNKKQCSGEFVEGPYCAEYGDPQQVCCLSAPDVSGIWTNMKSETNSYNQTSFKFLSGRNPTFSNWALNQPSLSASEKCVSLYKKDERQNSQRYYAGEWLVQECNLKNNYICKKNLELVPVTAPITVEGCPENFIRYEEKCFMINTTPLKWSEAEAKCVSYGGNLATIANRFDQYWVNLNIPKDTVNWIGLSHGGFSDIYKWNTGEDFSFSHWAKNYPNITLGKCVAVESTGFWINQDCDTKSQSICQTWNKIFTTTAAPTTTTPPKCEYGWTEADDTCYRAYKKNSDQALSWYDADKYCQHIGGHLSSFKSLNSLINVLRGQSVWDTGSYNYQPYWIGLNRLNPDEGWQHSDGSAVGFLNWDYNYPKGDDAESIYDCVEVAGSQKMRNVICYEKKSWFCSIEKGMKPLGDDDFDPPPTFNITDCANNGDYKFSAFNGKCYYVSTGEGNEKLSWFKSRDFCQKQGGDLVSIHTTRELDYISYLVSKRNGGRQWLGLNQLATFTQGFVWSDGSPLNLVNWQDGEPNNANGGEKCVETLDNLKWNDANCANEHGFICEKSNGTATIPTQEVVLPLTFTDGTGDVCPEGYSTFGLFTTNSLGETNPCEFPFTYKGKEYTTCTTIDSVNPWCATTSDYDANPDKWGYCIDVKCFKVNEYTHSFSGARDACEEEDATLASIHNEIEQSYVTALLKNSLQSDHWIGLWNPDGQDYYFEDNTEVEITKWAPNNPTNAYGNKNCVTMSSDPSKAGLWQNDYCYYSKPSVCSKYPNGVRYSSGCEASFLGSLSENITLSCPSDQTIAIIKADFGRKKNSMTCDNKFHYTGECTSEVETTDKVRELCQNNNTCYLTASTSQFSDPCENVIKQLKVWYQCVKTPITSTGGNGGGAACNFPFNYNGRMHYQCTHEVLGSNPTSKRWCCTNEDCDQNLKWGYCPEAKHPIKHDCEKDDYSSLDGGQNCYKHYLGQDKTWDEANNMCIKDSGNLVTISNAFDQSFLRLISYLSAAQENKPWIGLKKEDSLDYKWADKWPVDYVNWAEGSTEDSSSIGTNKSCVYIEPESGKWNVSSCDIQRSFICRITKEQIPTTTVAPPQLCPVDQDWKYNEGMCYLYISKTRSYPAADYDCVEKGGHVAAVTSSEKSDFIKDLTTSYTQQWIGLQKNPLNSLFEWADGSPLVYENFVNTFREERCVYMSYSYWYTSDCLNERSYTCQRDPILSNLTTTTTTTSAPITEPTLSSKSTTSSSTVQTLSTKSTSKSSKSSTYSSTEMPKTTLKSKNKGNSTGVLLAGIIIGVAVLLCVGAVFTIYALNKKGITNIQLPFVSQSSSNAYVKMSDIENKSINSISNPTYQ